jgi:hypothetical protein
VSGWGIVITACQELGGAAPTAPKLALGWVLASACLGELASIPTPFTLLLAVRAIVFANGEGGARLFSEKVEGGKVLHCTAASPASPLSAAPQARQARNCCRHAPFQRCPALSKMSPGSLAFVHIHIHIHLLVPNPLQVAARPYLETKPAGAEEIAAMKEREHELRLAEERRHAQAKQQEMVALKRQVLPLTGPHSAGLSWLCLLCCLRWAGLVLAALGWAVLGCAGLGCSCLRWAALK